MTFTQKTMNALLGLTTVAAVGVWAINLTPTLQHSNTPRFATCTGAADCKACRSCKACKHCAKEKGTCGICR